MISICGVPKFDGFTVTIDGNDGEEQLVLVMSSGHGKTAIVAVHAQIDGTVQIVHKGTMSYGMERCILSGILGNWISVGHRPPAGELIKEMEIAARVVNQICDAFFI